MNEQTNSLHPHAIHSEVYFIRITNNITDSAVSSISTYNS